MRGAGFEPAKALSQQMTHLISSSHSDEHSAFKCLEYGLHKQLPRLAAPASPHNVLLRDGCGFKKVAENNYTICDIESLA